MSDEVRFEEGFWGRDLQMILPTRMGRGLCNPLGMILGRWKILERSMSEGTGGGGGKRMREKGDKGEHVGSGGVNRSQRELYTQRKN